MFDTTHRMLLEFFQKHPNKYLSVTEIYKAFPSYTHDQLKCCLQRMYKKGELWRTTRGSPKNPGKYYYKTEA